MQTMKRAAVSGHRWTEAIERFNHAGPGGDVALIRQEPELAHTLKAIPPGDTQMFAGVPVTRQADCDWAVFDDRNLASPWVVVQAIKSVLRDR